MSSCIICFNELKFSNTPIFGAGKLNDGNILCSSCFKTVNKINPFVARKLKTHSLSDIQTLLVDGNNTKKKEIEVDPRVQEIRDEIKLLQLPNSSTYLGRREIDELPQILSKNEKINNIIQGLYNKGQGILVSTDRRLIFIDKGLVFGLKVEDFPLDKITSIQYETGLMFGKVKIHTSSNIATIDNVDKASARMFSEFVRDKLSQSSTKNTKEESVIDQIEKLAKLKESGILTDEEFTVQKKKLLEKL